MFWLLVGITNSKNPQGSTILFSCLFCLSYKKVPTLFGGLYSSNGITRANWNSFFFFKLLLEHLITSLRLCLWTCWLYDLRILLQTLKLHQFDPLCCTTNGNLSNPVYVFCFNHLSVRPSFQFNFNLIWNLSVFSVLGYTLWLSMGNLVN